MFETFDMAPNAWLFGSKRKHVQMRPANFLRRVLKPAAINAGVGVATNVKGEKTTAVNSQSLRRMSSTLFGARPKDPKVNQAHMRHADPHVTLKHHQQACRPPLLPAECRDAVKSGYKRNWTGRIATTRKHALPSIRYQTVSDWLDITPQEAERLTKYPPASRFWPAGAEARPAKDREANDGKQAGSHLAA